MDDILFKARQWGISIDQPLIIDDVDGHPWDDSADLVIVGLGGAGVAAALEGLERGIEVIAVDRYGAGGSSAANGGIYYAGGGTSIQQDAGETDSVEEMFKYLQIEVGGVVSDETLWRFCKESVPTMDWLIGHGVKFNSNVWKKKCSYPPLDYFLYHPDSSLAAPYARQAKPAARGHRIFVRNGKKAWGLGIGIYGPLRDAALRLGMRFYRYAEARQIALDRNGNVVGVKVLHIPTDSAAANRFGRSFALASKWIAALPSSFPLAGAVYGVGRRYLKKAHAIEETYRKPRWLRARRGVILSAGGFCMNQPMIEHFAPKYGVGLPMGTLGDNGSGIMLGASAGGALDHMGRISAWRFINPPSAWAMGMLVNRKGERFVNETLYGAAIGDAIAAQDGGKAWIILDARLRRMAKEHARDPKLVPFQRDIAKLNHVFNCVKANSLDALADKIGFDQGTLKRTIEEYNLAASGKQPDIYEKGAEDMAVLGEAPFYAIDASTDSKLLPMPVMSVGGLRVDERSGQVLAPDGNPIGGLYAAGRNAVGICSNIYLSGLSYADCIFSGRRVARHVAEIVDGEPGTSSTVGKP